MDTTSHRFSWTVQVLGETGSSLNDVAILNDSLAYAVGEIYLKDSTGQIDPIEYNLAKWDGKGWAISRILFPLCDPSGNQQALGPYTAQGVWAFSAKDIWMCSGGSLAHWDGQTAMPFCMSLGYGVRSLRKMWGVNGTLYLVGTNGFIAFYNGHYWQQLVSGTTLSVNDVWGAQNSFGEWEILAVASNDFDRRLLRIQGTSVSTAADSGLSNTLMGVWFAPGVHYYVVGTGIHYKNTLNDPFWNRYASGVVTSFASSSVRGNGANDVFVVGSYFEVVHFNGSSWYNYQKEIPLTEGSFGRVAIKGNLVIAVGLVGQQAAVLIGRR
jgi:hypothetical protein